MKLKWMPLTVFSLILLGGCGEETLPKPKAMLRLEYPRKAYRVLESECPYEFEYNQMAVEDLKEGCNLVLDYPQMKGSIFISYKPVTDNLRSLLSDAQKLSYEHVVKADNIVEQPYINPDHGVYGMFYEVRGDAASQSQFYVTDSTDHFVIGSLYFDANPNYDSILPAAVYLQQDIRRIMESLRWK
ncbi:gliding motility lipoprotein GldD [Robiginitalea sp. SC105]|uniref:gliding motility lipoprotein GldD n=1 Tax=Robiginitalea sp. SC105 TaxID=2762332 RepID=UPI00163ADEF0|nr:gliding motility lipoprotein GldD [Robiginitalea sp. SC105]MBC2837960.1 gliding motility lipoprotein GldD [Robiginitalea sp. SC105]